MNHEIRLKELRSLRDKLAKNPYENRTELVWIRKEIKTVQTIISNYKKKEREVNAPVKLSMFDSKNADKIWGRLYKEGKL